MIEFMKNIWEWLQSNKESIIAFVSSSNFAAVIGMIIATIKQSRTSSDNTKSINKVTEALSNNNVIKSDVEEVKTVSEKTEKAVLDCNNKVDAVEAKINDFMDNFGEKLNAMMEVQSIVYSTINDDTIRTAVNSVLIQAKHSGAKAKAELEKELEDIKAKFNEAVSTANTKITETVDKVKSTMDVSNVPQENVETKRTRY